MIIIAMMIFRMIVVNDNIKNTITIVTVTINTKWY